MLSWKLFGAGLNENVASAIGTDVAQSLVATGTIRSQALELVNEVNYFTTVPTNAGTILYTKAVPGDKQYVFNAGTNTLNIYPHTTAARFNAQATGSALALGTSQAAMCVCFTPLHWGA